MALAYIEKVTQNRIAFENKVKVVSSNLGIMPDWLMIVMYAESSLNHLAKSVYSSAVGLIQFTAETLTKLGITATQLLSLSNVQQLDYVQKYFQVFGFSGKMKSVYDVYLAVFAPVGVGKSENTVLYKSPSAAYTGNKALDIENDGTITVSNVKTWFSRFIPVNIQKDSANTNTGFWLAVVAFVAVFNRKKIIKFLS